MSKLRYVMTCKWADLRFSATVAAAFEAVHMFSVAGKEGGWAMLALDLCAVWWLYVAVRVWRHMPRGL